MKYLAHLDGEREQTVAEHLEGTAALAEQFAAAFGAGAEARRCGMLHDIGKYSREFQRRVHGAPIRVDHSSAGAVEAARLRDIPAAFCVAGHHGGLPDGGTKASASGTLTHRFLPETIRALPDYGAFRGEIAIPPASVSRDYTAEPRACLFFTRMLYSCLVDADFLDTERFMRAGDVGRDGFPAADEYRATLMRRIQPWLNAEGGGLGGLRSEILRAAIARGATPPGLFTFTAPTGSGKTISSLAFALSHMRENGLRRVIYAIPYCSIIEQTQDVFEDIFGPGSVVAHYANVEYENGENERDRRYLAAENWDAPLILTTTVQLFESLFANRSSQCRKLHNIAGSVILFDEAQMLPTQLLRPCLHAICELVQRYGCTAVLCTATQPALTPLLREWMPECSPVEICPRPDEMFDAFRRVRYEKLGRVSDGDLVAQLSARNQALCVVNRRQYAQEIYRALPEEGRFHLSTTLCAADRRRILAEIRERLRMGLPCRAVSTSLIEAGVDVDFPAVYRELAGLDSIIQSGGRCNREGVPGTVGGTVYIFESGRRAPKGLEQNLSSARMALEQFSDIAAPEAVKRYFEDLYDLKGPEALDIDGILSLCSENRAPFAEIAKRFRVINDGRRTVYIPCEQSSALLNEWKAKGPSRALLRALGPYAVGVYPDHYENLLGRGAVEPIAPFAGILTDMELYRDDTGLTLTREEGLALFS